MKVSEQVKQIDFGLDNSTHSFFSKLAAALTARIEQDTGIKLSFVGKETTGSGSMNATLTGQFVDVDEKKVDGAAERLERLMAELKNPTNLIGLLK